MTPQGSTHSVPPTAADSRTAPPPDRETCRLISDYAAIAAEHVRDVAWLVHATHGDQPTGRNATNALRDTAHALDRAQNIYRTWYRKFDLFIITGIGVAALTGTADQSGAFSAALGILAGLLAVTSVDKLERHRTKVRRARLPAPTCLPDPDSPIDNIIEYAAREALAAHLLVYELVAMMNELMPVELPIPHPAWERRLLDTGSAVLAAERMLHQARTHIVQLVDPSPAT
ncbi:hypothetical protein GCM10027280_06730 [Micromonospora polyrhachis]|uniref:Uncharacterized protein n=1 Tax=Micromonospora polyrhachis TaxID=1282883 RepID=A0A7W7WLR7_9ACTN|nr:hypothetical protein [Micromonospora polyrhachis]MBB4956416.1 hypothetical protein [Micromonospora polyrhachis]